MDKMRVEVSYGFHSKMQKEEDLISIAWRYLKENKRFMKMEKP